MILRGTFGNIMNNFNFWQQVRIRQEEAEALAGVDFYDMRKHNVEGFVAKSKYSKKVKQLVNEVEMLRQLPVEYRKL